MQPVTYPLEPLFGRILSPFERFLRRTTAGGIVLVATTALALGVATVFDGNLIEQITRRTFGLGAGEAGSFELSLHQWVNDALMTLFFLLVGLELKREMLVGELASLREAALPVIAAVGGMVVPALVYAAFNAQSGQASGWGIPMATDIAFAVGILVLLALRIPRNLVIFVTALAIADDLGAVLVIGVFYTPRMDFVALGVAAFLFGVLALFNRGGIRHPLPYGVLGVALWFAVHASGAHATLTGILLAAMVPARPSFRTDQFERRVAGLLAALREKGDAHDANDGALPDERLARIAESMEESAIAVQSPLQRMEHALAPWVTFLVIPVFALVNAGIDLAAVSWREAFSDRVTLGVMTGLAFGKFCGVSLFSWIAVRLGIARLPAGVRWKHLLGAAWLTGIGFTMSLFIAELALSRPESVEAAKLGILTGSALSAAIGLAWLYVAGRGDRTAAPVYNEAP